jgi:hypothetical protein
MTHAIELLQTAFHGLGAFLLDHTSFDLDFYRHHFLISLHVSKVGSDVNFLIFDVLPIRADGVIIYFHNIFRAFEYSTVLVYKGRAWNEAYLLHAFLQYKPRFQLLLFSAWRVHWHENELRKIMPHCLDRVGSFCIQKSSLAKG